MIHVLVALAIQACTAGLALLLGLPLQAALLVGAAAGMWKFIGREWAQAEYRAIEAFYGKRERMPWHEPLHPRNWTVKSMLDWIVPTVVVLTVAWLATVSGG